MVSLFLNENELEDVFEKSDLFLKFGSALNDVVDSDDNDDDDDVDDVDDDDDVIELRTRDIF